MGTYIQFTQDYAAHQSGDEVEMNRQFAELMVRLGLARFMPGPKETQQAGPSETKKGLAAQLVDVPGIGPKQATRLAQAGVKSLGDLVGVSAEELASQVAGIGARQVRKWQDKARRWITFNEDVDASAG